MKTQFRYAKIVLPVLAALGLHTQIRAGTPLHGFADLHTHAFANLGFGGELFFGQPYDPNGNITNALSSCACSHHLCVLGNPTIAKPVVLAIEGTHASSGLSRFDGWPKHTSLLHRQMCCEWLLRAYMGELPLLVIHAVNNKLLCDLHAATGGAARWGAMIWTRRIGKFRR